MRLPQQYLLLTVLAAVAIQTAVTGFAPTPLVAVTFSRPTTASNRYSSSSSSSSWALYSMQQQPNESRAAYFQRLSKAAADPAAFERLALGQDKDATTNTNNNTNASNNSKKTHKVDTTVGKSHEDPAVLQEKKKRGYQRAEDWEADLAHERENMSWEEKVQFDGQRHGDRFAQNEILRKNLNFYH